MSKKMLSNFMLLFTAIIWGSAFVAQKSGMDYIGPFTYGGIRTFIGGLALIPVIAFMNNRSSKKAGKEEQTKVFDPEKDKTAFIGGLCCGAALFVASSLQQFGMLYTTAGKAGFITTLYVVFVPILSLFLRKRVRPIMWICVALGAAGLYLLCMTDASFQLQRGDTLVLLCAVAFAVHILVIDYFAPKADGVKISCVQFLFAGALVLAARCVPPGDAPRVQGGYAASDAAPRALALYDGSWSLRAVRARAGADALLPVRPVTRFPRGLDLSSVRCVLLFGDCREWAYLVPKGISVTCMED